MSGNVLGQKDANAPIEQHTVAGGKDVKNMEYHRQMLQSKIQEPCASLPLPAVPQLLTFTVPRRTSSRRPTTSCHHAQPRSTPFATSTRSSQSLHALSFGDIILTNNRAKPKSLFAQASAKKLSRDGSALGEAPARS